MNDFEKKDNENAESGVENNINRNSSGEYSGGGSNYAGNYQNKNYGSNGTNYSYSYGPNGYYGPENNPQNNQEKKPNKKGKKTAALAILIVVCMIMSSIATALVVSYVYKSDKNHQEQGQLEGNRPHGGVDGPVIIDKGPGSKVEVEDGTIGQSNMSVAQVSKLVADSVVEITTSSVKYDIFYGQQIVSGAGSGVIIGQGKNDTNLYYIVTNEHVIDNAEKVTARLRNGKEFNCEIIGSDIISDIAILQIESEDKLVKACVGNSDNLMVGDEVIVIGNPLGQLGGTVTNGIISALGRDVNVEGLEMELLQTNAAISPGNSGGGMFNTSGELVGIVNAKSNDQSAEGLGFAIPINTAYTIIDDILSYGYVTGRAALPITVKQYMSSSMIGATTSCLVVTSEEGDFKFNDVLYSIDGKRLITYNNLVSLLSKHEVGDKVTVQVARTVGREVKFYEFEIKLIESIPTAIE